MKIRRENEENSARGSSRSDGANCAEKRKKMLQRKCYRQNAEKMAQRKIAREGNRGARNCAEKLGKEGHDVEKMVQGKCRGNGAEKKQSHHRFRKKVQVYTRGGERLSNFEGRVFLRSDSLVTVFRFWFIRPKLTLAVDREDLGLERLDNGGFESRFF